MGFLSNKIWVRIFFCTIKTCVTLSSAGRIQLWDLRHKSQCTTHVVVVVEVCNRKAISNHYKHRILFSTVRIRNLLAIATAANKPELLQ